MQPAKSSAASAVENAASFNVHSLRAIEGVCFAAYTLHIHLFRVNGPLTRGIQAVLYG